MAELSVYGRSETPNFVAADAAGDQFRNNGDTEALVLNQGGVARTITVPAQRKCKHGFTDDYSVVIQAGELRRVGPFEHGRFGDSTLMVHLTYDDESDLVVAAQRLR